MLMKHKDVKIKAITFSVEYETEHWHFDHAFGVEKRFSNEIESVYLMGLDITEFLNQETLDKLHNEIANPEINNQ